MASKIATRAQKKPLRPILKPSLSISRPIEENPKPQITISTSAILRKKPLKHSYGKRKSRRYVQPGEDHEIFLDYKEKLNDSRNDIYSTSCAALDASHADLTTQITNLQISDTTFLKNIEAQRDQLLAPLAADKVQTVFTRDGKSTTVVLEMGPRVEAFRVMLVKKEAEIEQCWSEWERVQAQILQLGIEVFGAEALGMKDEEAGVGVGGSGYRAQMEQLDLEHREWREEIEEEIKLVGRKAIKKMEATEKELSAEKKKQKVNLFAMLFDDDDDDDD